MHLPTIFATAIDPFTFHKKRVISWIFFVLLVLYVILHILSLFVNKFSILGVIETFVWIVFAVAWFVVIRTFNRRIFILFRFALFIWIAVMVGMVMGSISTNLINYTRDASFFVLAGLSIWTSYLSWESTQKILAPHIHDLRQKLGYKTFTMTKRDYQRIQNELTTF